MKKVILIMSLTMVGAVLNPNKAVAQQSQSQVVFNPDEVYGVAVGSEELAKKAYQATVSNGSEVKALRDEVAKLRNVKPQVRVIQTRVEGGTSQSVLRDIADLKRITAGLSAQSSEAIQPMVDKAIEVTLKGKASEFAESLKGILEAAERKAGTYSQRIVSLEADMVEVKKDVKEIKETLATTGRGSSSGVNLAPEFLAVVTPNGVAFDFGARLSLPAAKNGWEVGLEGLLGVTRKKEFTWGVGVDMMKRLKRYVSIGPAVNFYAVDNPSTPGIGALTATGGFRTDFHAGPVDFVLGGGIGVTSREDKSGFGWNVYGGMRARCF